MCGCITGKWKPWCSAGKRKILSEISLFRTLPFLCCFQLWDTLVCSCPWYYIFKYIPNSYTFLIYLICTIVYWDILNTMFLPLSNPFLLKRITIISHKGNCALLQPKSSEGRILCRPTLWVTSSYACLIMSGLN